MSKKQNDNKKMSPRVIVKLVLIIAIPCLIVFFVLLASGLSYINAYNSTKVTPYAPTVTKNDDGTESTTDKISGIYLTDVKRLDNKEFKLFDITFECTKYNDRKDDKVQSLSFNLTIKSNDDTPADITFLPSSTTYKVKAAVALCSDWVNLNSYSTSLTQMKIDDTGSRTLTVSCPVQFPAQTTSCWPVPVTIATPTCYLYLYYRTQEKGVYKEYAYILQYTYEEFMTETTEGAIQR